MVDLQAAYAACARDCRRTTRTFPVASLLLPRRMRPHVAAVYAFARAADDFADEGERTVDERLRCWTGGVARLREAVAGRYPRFSDRRSAASRPIRGDLPCARCHVSAAALPLELLEDLLSAFRQDVTVTRYATWTALFDYCRRSANPIGRLVLRIGGYADDELDRWSDAICTALQLTNFWQDVESDYDRGRIYLPLEEMQAHPADEMRSRAPPRHRTGGRQSRPPSPERARCSTMVCRSAIAFAVACGTRFAPRGSAGHASSIASRL